MSLFVIARIVQGAAGGAGITVSRASVGDLFEERELARMYAILTMALVLGTSLSPYAGGVITRHLGWHAGFLMLAGAALVIALACYAWLPETRAANAQHPQLRGVVARIARGDRQARVPRDMWPRRRVCTRCSSCSPLSRRT